MLADFRQFYKIDLPIDGEVPDIGRAALLWESLPDESRCARRMRPQKAWNDGEWMLWSIEYHIRLIAWSFSKDAKKNRNQPEPLPTPQGNLEQPSEEQLAARERLVARQLGYDPDEL